MRHSNHTKSGVELFLQIRETHSHKMKIVFYRDFIKSESYRLSKLGTGPTHPSVRHKIGYGP